MIQIDISKAKEIAHEKRRASRAVEFAPLDTEATIPTLAEQAEAERQAIRNKYALIQNQIEVASTAEELAAIIDNM